MTGAPTYTFIKHPYDTSTITWADHGTATSAASDDMIRTWGERLERKIWLDCTNTTATDCGGYKTFGTGPWEQVTWKTSAATTDGWTNLYCDHPVSRRDRIAEIIRNRHAPAIASGKTPVGVEIDEREFRARETLRAILGQDAYQRYLKSGFTTAHNRKSGYTYQIFYKASGHRLTRAYKPGQPAQLLCIYLQGNFAPTDFVITLYLMAVNNDQRIWEIANKHGEHRRSEKLVAVDGRPLTEIYRKLKVVA